MVDRAVAQKEIGHGDPKIARPPAGGIKRREEESFEKTVLAVGRFNESAEMRPL
jgi:hypothetical protein